MTAGQAASTTAANHFAAFDDRNQEIYFTCMPDKWRQVEISPGGWAETLPSFSMIEVRKRSKWDSTTRAVREQAAVSGPRPLQPPVQPLTEWAELIVSLICIWVLYVYVLLPLFHEGIRRYLQDNWTENRT